MAYSEAFGWRRQTTSSDILDKKRATWYLFWIWRMQHQGLPFPQLQIWSKLSSWTCWRLSSWTCWRPVLTTPSTVCNFNYSVFKSLVNFWNHTPGLVSFWLLALNATLLIYMYIKNKKQKQHQHKTQTGSFRSHPFYKVNNSGCWL